MFKLKSLLAIVSVVSTLVSTMVSSTMSNSLSSALSEDNSVLLGESTSYWYPDEKEIAKQ